MGNCIVQLNKVMQTGWEVAEHNKTMKVHRVSPNVLPVVQQLRIDNDMVGGQMYYQVPLPIPSLDFEKKPAIEEGSDGNNGVLRLKLVITKQELEVMLRKGAVSVGDLVSHTKTERSIEADVIDDEDNRNCGRWKPVLDSIPELN